MGCRSGWVFSEPGRGWWTMLKEAFTLSCRSCIFPGLRLLFQSGKRWEWDLRKAPKADWITRRIRVMAGRLCASVLFWVGLGGKDVRSQVWLAVKEASVVAQMLVSSFWAISSQTWVGVRTRRSFSLGCSLSSWATEGMEGHGKGARLSSVLYTPTPWPIARLRS